MVIYVTHAYSILIELLKFIYIRIKTHSAHYLLNFNKILQQGFHYCQPATKIISKVLVIASDPRDEGRNPQPLTGNTHGSRLRPA